MVCKYVFSAVQTYDEIESCPLDNLFQSSIILEQSIYL